MESLRSCCNPAWTSCSYCRCSSVWDSRGSLARDSETRSYQAAARVRECLHVAGHAVGDLGVFLVWVSDVNVDESWGSLMTHKGQLGRIFTIVRRVGELRAGTGATCSRRNEVRSERLNAVVTNEMRSETARGVSFGPPAFSVQQCGPTLLSGESEAIFNNVGNPKTGGDDLLKYHLGCQRIHVRT